MSRNEDALGSGLNEGLGAEPEQGTCLWCQQSMDLETALGTCCWEEMQKDRKRYRDALDEIANSANQDAAYLARLAEEALGSA